MRAWLFWPSSVEYAVPWALGPILVLALASFGAPGTTRPGWPFAPTTPVAQLIAAAAAGVLFEALLLFLHIRPTFASWRTALRPWLGTYLVLAAGYAIVWGFILLLRGDAVWALGSADPRFMLRCAITAVLALLPALAVAALWKVEEPGLSAIRLARRNARTMLGRVRARSITKPELGVLMKSLGEIVGQAPAQIAKAPAPRDQRLLAEWLTASKALGDYYKNRAAEDVRADGFPDYVREMATSLDKD